MYEKSNYQKKKLNINVREFGFVILSLIFNIDEANFIQSPNLIRQKVLETKIKYGEDLYNFVSFLIECRSNLSFKDVQTFLKNKGHPCFLPMSQRRINERFETRARRGRARDPRASRVTAAAIRARATPGARQAQSTARWSCRPASLGCHASGRSFCHIYRSPPAM